MAVVPEHNDLERHDVCAQELESGSEQDSAAERALCQSLARETDGLGED